MCYSGKDQTLEERARRLKAEEDRRRRVGSERPSEEKPLTEKVKEMVGAR